MREIPYKHRQTTPAILLLHGLVVRWLSRRLRPQLRRLLPGPHGRQIIAIVLLGLSIVVQVVLVYVAAELVDLAISISELWALLAQKHLEITL